MRKNRVVFDALVMVLQFGINMLVPIFLMTGLGVWIGNRTGVTWITIPLFFIGAIAGGNNIYRQSKKLIQDSEEHNKSSLEESRENVKRNAEKNQ